MCPPETIPSLQASDATTLPNFGAVVPATEISQAAYKHAASILHESILSHSIRVYLYAKTLAASRNSIYHIDPAKHDQLFVACLFHDIGTTDNYNGPQRFEIEGADAAVAFLSKFGLSDEDQKQVWYTIALHDTNGIVDRMGELPELMRRALDVEFHSEGWQSLVGFGDVVEFKTKLEESYPRADIEKVLGDAVTLQAIGRPQKAPAATWPGGLYRAYLQDPDWKGVNKAF